MNKHMKIALSTLALTAIFTGCAPATEPVDSSVDESSTVEQPSTDQEAPSEETPIKDNAPSATALFLEERPIAPEIGVYLKENLADISTDDQTLALQQLLLAQQETIDEMHKNIYNSEYMTALNETMGGDLTPELIQNIADDDAKAAFQELVDGYMTIVRYEEYPTVEPDWTRLNALNMSLSVEMQSVIDIRDKLQTGAFTSDMILDHDGLSSSLATVEELIDTMDGFERYQACMLYDDLISTLFVGTEGHQMSLFTNGDPIAEEAWQSISEEYDSYAFGQLARKLVDAPVREWNPLFNIVNGFRMFSPDSALEMTLTYTEEENYSIDGVELSGHESAEIQSAINQKLVDELLTLRDPDAKINRMRIGVNFSNDHILSVYLDNIAYDENDDYQSYERYMVLDMQTGEELTLDDLFGASFEAYQETLQLIVEEKRVGVPLLERPSFYLYDDQLVLLIQDKEKASPHFISLNYYDLSQLMDITKLY